MAVSNGQIANQTTFNNAFLSRTQDSDTVAKIDLNNPDTTGVEDVQSNLNSESSYTGRPINSSPTIKPVFTNNQVGVAGDDLRTRTDLLTGKFDGTTGHGHTGAAGDGPLLNDLSVDAPLQGYNQEAIDLTGVTGGDHDVSTELSLKEPSTSDIVKGVPSLDPYNKVYVRFTASDDPIEDGSGNQVYGRLTNTGGLGGTWTLTFYVDDAGTETPYSFAGSNDIRFWYQELFHPLESSRPVYSQEFFIPSDNATQDVVDATAVQAGKVSVSQQTFGGEKNFNNGIATERSDVASAATIAALVNTGSFVKITGATATTIQGIAAPTGSTNKRLIIHNGASNTLTIAHQNLSALAANRIITPDGSDVTVDQNSSIELIYEDAQSRWVVVSSGVGGDTILGFQEDIGTGNGATTSFGPLTNTAIDEDSVLVFIDGVAQDKADWSLSGSNIVFGTAPATDQLIYVYYLYNGTPPPPFVPSGVEQLEFRTISGGEAAAKALTLVATPASALKVMVDVIGGTAQEYTVDYTVSGATLDWNGLGLDGVLAAGDKLRIHYWS